jgi:hypothetical protein
MILRALLVFLIVINVGIAAWWALRDPPRRDDRIELPADVPRLQLLSEVPPRPRSVAPPPTASVAAATAAVPDDARCVAFGPYENPALLRRANEVLQPQVLRARVRNETTGARGWRVLVPPLASREAAQALADRMTAAGLDDLLVMPTGVDANGVALGRFGSEDSARRREAQVRAAGFGEAKVEPIGDVRTQGWIDVAATQAFDAAVAAREVAAPRTTPVDCATLR